MKKKFPKNPKYTQIALYTFITIGALMILWQLIGSSSNLLTSFKEAFSFLWGSIATIVFGLILGYILSPGVAFFEKLLNKLFNRKKTKKKEKRLRLFSILILYILLIVLIILIVVFIIPPLVENVVQFSESLPDYIDEGIKWYDENLKDSPLFTSEYTKDIMDSSSNNFTEQINEIALSVVTTLINSILAIFSSVLKFSIALIIAFYYLLSSKDVFSGLSEFARLKLGEKRSLSIGSFLKSVDWVFGKYISAKLLQVVIIFVMAQAIFLILGVGMSTLMAFILSVANIVPYIGSFVGMVPPLLISLIDSPSKAIWVLASLLVLQFIDGYIIQPFLIGDKMGLSPFWALVVIIVGGNLFGLPGILLSIPVAAVFSILVKQYLKSQRAKLEMEGTVK